MNLELKNPHSVLAALEHRPEDVLEVRVRSRTPGGAWEQVLELAQRLGRPLSLADRTMEPRGKRRSGPKSERAGVALAIVRERRPVALEDVLGTPDADQPGVWLALDCLQDPHNVGAIFRTASFFGIRGVVSTKDRSAPMSGTVYDVAAGGVESVPFAIVPNLRYAFDKAKEAGLWILGSSEHADRDISHIPCDRPRMLVIGNEEKGLRRLTLEHCDEVCRITPRGAVTSLNASVAAGVMMAMLTAKGSPA